MSANSKIEWCDHTFNPWIGCTKVSPGCDNCYAAAWDRRFATSGHAMRWGADKPRSLTKTWGDPVRWNKQHAAFFAEHGRRQRVFCASLADVFDNEVDPTWRSELFMLISETPNLDWLLLTKRIGNAAAMLPVWYQDPEAWEFGGGSAYPNVWLGATVVNQEEADRDIPKLLAVPAARRFLSLEPLLGPVDLTMLNNPGPLHQRGAFINGLRGGTYGLVPSTQERHRITHGPIESIDWVIAGGESGSGARPSHPDWYRSLRNQCAAAGVPFLFKQWGSWTLHEVDADCTVEPGMPMDFKGLRHWDRGAWDEPAGDTPDFLIFKPGAVLAMPANKKAAGRLLDGIEHNGFPP